MEEGFATLSEFDAVVCDLIAERDTLKKELDTNRNFSAKSMEEGLRLQCEIDELVSLNCSLTTERTDANRNVTEKSMEERLRMQREYDELISVNRSLVAERDALQTTLKKRKETVGISNSVDISKVIEALEKKDQERIVLQNESKEAASSIRRLTKERDTLQKILDNSIDTQSILSRRGVSQVLDSTENIER